MLQQWIKPELTELALEPEEDVLVTCYSGVSGYRFNSYCHAGATACHSG